MQRRPVVLTALTMVLIILILHALGIPLLPEAPDSAALRRILSNRVSRTVTGEVVSSDERDGYQIIILRHACLVDGSEAFNMGRIRLTSKSEKHFSSGDILIVRGIAEEINPPTNPGGFDQELYWRLKNISCTMKVSGIKKAGEHKRPLYEHMLLLRARAKKRIMSSFPESEGEILCAMLIGDKSSLSDENRLMWQSGGITHMLCISGLHLTLLGMGLFRLLRKCRVMITPSGIISIAVMAFYTVFTGMSVSTVRAFIMFVFSVTALMAGRTRDTATSLAFSAILILAENPYYLFYSGFLMSYGAIIICGFFRRRSKVTVALMLYLWMLPLTMSVYYEIPTMSILINLIAVPLLPAILLSGMIGTLFGSVCSAASFPAVFILRLIRRLLEVSQRMPYSEIILGKPAPQSIFIYLCVLSAWSFFHWKWRRAPRRFLLFPLIPLIIMLLAHMPDGKMRLTFMDVGQGDGIAASLPNGMNLLIDSGSSTVSHAGSRCVLPCIKALGMRKIDYLFVTHTDADHMNGIVEIMGLVASGQTSLKIKTVVLPYMRHKSPELIEMANLAASAGARVIYVSSGDSLTLGKCSVKILNPDPSLDTGPETDTNGQCIVMLISYSSFDALLTGDVYGAAEDRLAKIGYPSRIEVLKVAHHGSKYSTGEDFLEAARPISAVISSGTGNTYGHPSHETIKRLRQSGADIYRTDEGGAITVETDGERFTVTPYAKRKALRS